MALSIQDQALITKAAEQGLGVGAAATTASNLAIAAGNSINASSLAPVSPYALPPAPTPSVPPASAPDFGVVKAQEEFSKTSTDLKSLYDLLGTSTERTQELESQAGMPQLQARLNELNALDVGYQSDLSNIASQNLVGTVAQQGTATGELGRQANLKDLNYNAVIASQNINIQRATNNAVIASVQGQQANAQAQINRAIDLEFKPLESKIDYLSKFLSLNADRLSNAEQAQLQNQITRQKQAYDEGIKTKTDIYSVMTTAATNGADNATLQKIQRAKTAEEALQAAGSWVGTKDFPASVQEYEYAKAGGYAGTFTQYQNEDANRKKSIAAAGVAGSGLTPSQINSTVDSVAGAFDNEPIVKAYNTVQEGYQTISSIGVNTKSPADDIAFVYAFAKIMDPNSVVREGEYNTIQKYAQTWAANFGFSATRIFSNTNFLNADAKQKMLNALKPKVDTITNQYNNLNTEYQRQIDDAYAGKPRQITNYAAGNTQSSGDNNPLGI